MKVKEFNPKYKAIELIIYDSQTDEMYGFFKIFTWSEVVKKYGEYSICSVYDYNDTRTTSIIIQTNEYKEKALKLHNEPLNGKDYKKGYKWYKEQNK